MTAKKFVIKDDIIYFDDDVCGDFTEQNVLALLNKQYETIQWIKQDIKEIQINCIECEKKMREENEELEKDVEYWKQVASQYSNELNVFEHCKKYKTECKDIHWSNDLNE